MASYRAIAIVLLAAALIGYFDLIENQCYLSQYGAAIAALGVICQSVIANFIAKELKEHIFQVTENTHAFHVKSLKLLPISMQFARTGDVELLNEVQSIQDAGNQSIDELNKMFLTNSNDMQSLGEASSKAMILVFLGTIIWGFGSEIVVSVGNVI